MISAMSGVRVIDTATFMAGPLISTMFADAGADVIKVEHPRGDPLRKVGYSKDGVSLYWKLVNRNKRTVTLDLSQPEGAEILYRMVATADVLIENFRPGTFERWGITWERLHSINPRLIFVRVTGFGQSGPYAARPAFGTLAEAMSGWVFLNGDKDGPPILPPPGLADGVCGMAGAWLTAFALYHRDAGGGNEGQVIDLPLYEPLLMVTGSQLTAADQLGIVPQRTGSRSPNNAPRNMYRTADDTWLAVSTSSDPAAAAAMRVVGAGDLVGETWFRTGTERAAHAEQIDQHMQSWIGKRSLADVALAFTEAGVPFAPIYDASQVLADEHFAARESVITADDTELGPIRMQGVVGSFSETPSQVRWPGRSSGQDNEDVYGTELGLSAGELAELRGKGIIL
jgi:crotonobetainyl-CoA:carnitine CoA-transferase CaiB-like acyl-CoA transferase